MVRSQERIREFETSLKSMGAKTRVIASPGFQNQKSMGGMQKPINYDLSYVSESGAAELSQ